MPTPQVLEKVVTGLEELYEHDIADLDMQGDLFEYMLGKLSTAGRNGQFRTPKHIRDMMVAPLRPTPDDVICDPACGTAGFLISAAEYIRAHYESGMTTEQWEHFAGPAFTGYDTDPTMLRISATASCCTPHHPDVRYRDSVSKENDVNAAFTMCLANPAVQGQHRRRKHQRFSESRDQHQKNGAPVSRAFFGAAEKKGGQCACIVPDGVLFGSSKAHQSIRRELVEQHQLRAVISMPSGVFKPYAGVSTAVLIFTKTAAGGTGKVWFYDMQADGFSLDDKRTPVAQNDIPDIIARFAALEKEKERARTERSFFVQKGEIVANGYDLSLNKYKQVEYTPVEYPPTQQLMTELHELEMQISAGLAELEERCCDGETWISNYTG